MITRKITFKKSWFNPVFLWLTQRRDPYTVLYGGAGSGKSYAVAKALVYRCLSEPYFKCIYSRKVKNDIRDSCFALIRQTIDEAGLAELFHVNTTTMAITCKVNGNSFIARGMDSTEKVKSIADPSVVWLEEATEYGKADFDQLDLRLRTDKAENLQIILTLNPISKSNWIFQEFFEKATQTSATGEVISNVSGAYLHKSTYRDNAYIDRDKYEAKLARIRENDETLYMIYSLGEWGIEDPSKMFIRNFSRELHLSDSIVWNPALDTYVALDFNVRNTALIFQYTDSFIYCLREYRPQNDDLEDLCKQIRADYPNAFFYVNGDASGGNGSALTKGGQSAFELVRQYLGDPAYPLAWEQIRKPKANPRHNSSRLVTNIILKNEANPDPALGLKIHSSCIELIKDFESVKWIDGKIDKSEDSKGRTHCFVGETRIATARGIVPIKEVREGDLALTSQGFKRVLIKWNNGSRRVVRYLMHFDTFSVSLECTPDHKIKAGEKWIEIQNLKRGAKIHLIKSLTGSGIIYTKQSDILSEGENASILQYGNTLTARFLKGITYTTETAIRKITRSKIWSSSRRENTSPNTVGIIGSVRTRGANIPNGSAISLKIGTDPRSGARGIVNTLGALGRNAARFLKTVLFAEKNTRRRSRRDQSFVIKTAKLERLEVEESRIEQVYDLTVADAHEYFADGVLVHNCLDAFRYHIWYEHRDRIQFYDLDLLYQKGLIGKHEADEISGGL